jgi:hypothetical protein
MPNELNSVPDSSEPLSYQIRIKGHLGPEWADWFGGLRIMLEADGTTLLISPPIDQAALHGMLKKVRDLGLRLISVNPIDLGQPTADLSHQLTTGTEA